MKVLYVINGLGTGGAERSLAEMLPGLRDAGLDPVVACLFPRSEGVQDEVVAAGFSVRVLNLPGDGRSLLSRGQELRGRVRALRSVIREVRPTVVHTTHFESDLAGRLAARGTEALVMSSLVNTTYDPVRLADPSVSRVRLAGARALDGWTARHLTHHLHALTQSVKSAAIRDLGVRADRVSVVPRGRDPRRLSLSPSRRAAARAALGVAPGDEVLISVGRQEFQKGHEHLLRAFQIVAAHRPQALLLMPGRSGGASEKLERLRAGSADPRRVRFLGHRQDIPDLLAASDLFVFPSLYEGLGGAVIEAMALGLPAVVSDLDVLREVVEPDRSASLVPPADPGALAAAIEALLEDRTRAAAFGRRGREVFEQRFTLSRCVERMVQMYADVVDRSRPGASGLARAAAS